MQKSIKKIGNEKCDSKKYTNKYLGEWMNEEMNKLVKN